MIEIIPAIDVLGGRCVRLRQGEFETAQVYREDPLEAAKLFEEAGLRRLHLVDLDGARSGKVVNDAVLRRITAATSLQVDFGGGIGSDEEVERVLAYGAQQITCGSIAVREPHRFAAWLAKFGPERVILGADVRGGMVAVAGWQELSALPLSELVASFMAQGGRSVLCTDIERDGMLSGPAFDLYEGLIGRFPDLKLIASGGVRTVDDITRLAERGVYGVVIGRALYEGTVTLAELGGVLC